MILCLARPLCSTASQLVIALVCESLWWVPERVIEEESKQNKENWAAACKDLWLSSFRPARTQDSFRGSFHWNDSRAFKGFCAMSSRLWFPFISLNDYSDKEIRMIATDKNCMFQALLSKNLLTIGFKSPLLERISEQKDSPLSLLSATEAFQCNTTRDTPAEGIPSISLMRVNLLVAPPASQPACGRR